MYHSGPCDEYYTVSEVYELYPEENYSSDSLQSFHNSKYTGTRQDSVQHKINTMYDKYLKDYAIDHVFKDDQNVVSEHIKKLKLYSNSDYTIVHIWNIDKILQNTVSEELIRLCLKYTVDINKDVIEHIISKKKYNTLRVLLLCIHHHRNNIIGRAADIAGNLGCLELTKFLYYITVRDKYSSNWISVPPISQMHLECIKFYITHKDYSHRIFWISLHELLCFNREHEICLDMFSDMVIFNYCYDMLHIESLNIHSKSQPVMLLITKSIEYTQQINNKLCKWLPSDLVKYYIVDYYSLVPREKTTEDYTNSKPQQARTVYYSF